MNFSVSATSFRRQHKRFLLRKNKAVMFIIIEPGILTLIESRRNRKSNPISYIETKMIYVKHTLVFSYHIPAIVARYKRNEFKTFFHIFSKNTEIFKNTEKWHVCLQGFGDQLSEEKTKFFD